MATQRPGSSVVPEASCSRSNASRYGAGDGLLWGVSPEATMAANRSPTPATAITSSISCRSAPDAMAIGTALAAARTNSTAPGNRTEPPLSMAWSLTPLRATSAARRAASIASPWSSPKAWNAPTSS
jgi:hypothetical protein